VAAVTLDSAVLRSARSNRQGVARGPTMNRNELDTGEYDLRELQSQIAAVRPPVPPEGSRIAVTVGAASHPGLVRPNNEDHFLVGRLSRKADVLMTNLPSGYVPEQFEQHAYALAVADGMGGAAAGEVASALALSLGTSLTLDASRWHMRLDESAASDLAGRVREFFCIIDRALTERAQSDPGLTGMGTTLTVVYTVGLDALVFHIGDSRAYLARDGRLQQITRDETLAQAMADAGQIPADSVASHPMRHVLTRAIGASTGQADARVHHVRLQRGDRLLLCTDGLSDQVDDRGIARVLADTDDAQRSCDGLVEAALAAGGQDNISVVLARFA
jgi:protein phosphatase